MCGFLKMKGFIFLIFMTVDIVTFRGEKNKEKCNLSFLVSCTNTNIQVLAKVLEIELLWC